MSKPVNPEIFKAYDVRGIYPDQIDESVARDIGRGFVTYLKAKRIAVSRDMRVSSPSLAAAFIDGATSQGADVVDYGLAGTDMLYYAVAANGFEGGAQITASHNPKQYNGMKLVRQAAFPLSGDAGISDIREMIVQGTLPAPAAARGTRDDRRDAGALRRTRHGVHRPVRHQAVQRRARRRLRHRRAGGAPALRAAALPDDRAVLHDRRHLPHPRGEPAHRGEPPGHRRGGDPAEGGHRHRLGRRRRPLLLHRRAGRVRAGRLHHGAARRGVPHQAPGLDDHLRPARELRRARHRGALRRHGADEPRRPRLHQAADARRERDLRRRGDRALLLPRQLLRRQRVHPGAADPRADVAQGTDAGRAARAAARRSTSSRARSTPRSAA